MKRLLIVGSIVALAAVFAMFIVWQRHVAADILASEEITVDGATRHFRLVVPHSLSKPAPVVFAFHGLGDSPDGMAGYTRLDQLAAENGFILVYPAAHNLMWETVDVNAKNLNDNPDVRFFDRLLVHLAEHYDIDRGRVYAVGMSNGAAFVQLLGIARSKDIAAIAAHSGLKPGDIGPAEFPRPILLIAGGNDPVSQAMQTAAGQYRSAGHVADFISVPGLGHAWSARHNADIWKFLSQHSSSPKR